MLIIWKSKIYSSNVGVIWLHEIALIKVLELSWTHEIESREIGRIKNYVVWKEPVRNADTQLSVVQKRACGFP
jgi:hypothetical protein